MYLVGVVQAAFGSWATLEEVGSRLLLLIGFCNGKHAIIPHRNIMAAVEVVKKLYACYEKGDLDGVAELCTPDTVWTLRANAPAGSVPWIGTHRGPDAVKNDFLAAMGKNERLDSKLLTMQACIPTISSSVNSEFLNFRGENEFAFLKLA